MLALTEDGKVLKPNQDMTGEKILGVVLNKRDIDESSFAKNLVLQIMIWAMTGKSGCNPDSIDDGKSLCFIVSDGNDALKTLLFNISKCL